MPTSQPPLRSAQEVLTLANVLARLEHGMGLDEARVRQARGAVNTVCKILRRPPQAIPAAMPEIERLLNEVPRAARRQSDKTVANTKARLRALLVDADTARRLPPRGTRLTAEWGALEARLNEPRLKKGLSRLIRFASYRGLAPADVGDAELAAIAEDVRLVNWGRDVTSFWRQTAACWNEAGESIEGWPQAKLSPPDTPKRAARLPLEAFPTSFQEDLARYLQWAGGADPLAADAPARCAAPDTLRLRREQVRLAASALAEQLGRPGYVTDLAVLVDIEHVRRILTRYLDETHDRRPTAFIQGLAGTLVAIARHWVKAPDAHLQQLVRIRRRVAASSSGLTEKNRKTIHQLEDPALRTRLLRLPETLAAQARTSKLSPARRLQRIQIALAIELLLAAPMRLQNLATLRVNHQLQWPTGREGQVIISLRDTETKTAQPMEYELGEHTKALLHEYTDVYRSRARASRDAWLFVRMNGERVSDGALRDGITKAVQRELGVPITPHQFRHLAAAIVLDARPGAIGLVRDLLGHRNIKTTVAFYAGMRTRQAGREYDRILAQNRGVRA